MLPGGSRPSYGAAFRASTMWLTRVSLEAQGMIRRNDPYRYMKT